MTTIGESKNKKDTLVNVWFPVLFQQYEESAHNLLSAT